MKNMKEKSWIFKMALPASKVHLILDLDFVVVFFLFQSNLRGNSVFFALRILYFSMKL